MVSSSSVPCPREAPGLVMEGTRALAAEITVLEAGHYTFDFDCRGRWSGVFGGKFHVVEL